MKKKIVASMLTLAMAVSLVACGGGGNTASTSTPAGGSSEGGDGYHFEIVSKGFQHQYWQAVLQGAQEQCDEYGDTMNFVGPASESDIQDQVQMLNSAINQNPVAIGLAALDTEACLDAIQTAFDAGIPIVGFDSGVPGAPDGSVKANCATDNLNAGAIAAENVWEAIKDRLDGTKRIGVLSQDATSQSVGDRGLGFINKIGELANAAGLKVAVIGNDKFVDENKVENTVAEGEADIIIEVLVPAQVTSELSTIDCQTLLAKKDTIAIFGSNQHSGEAMKTANDTAQKFGTGADQVIGVAFDAGATIKGAVADGTFLGAVTQSPLQMGRELIKALHTLAEGGTVSDVDTGCAWYTADNMNDADIAPNLYD